MKMQEEYVTLAENGRVPVPPISTMSASEINAEISSYTEEDLLNQDTADRLGNLRVESTPMAVVRIRAQEAVKKRLLERRKRSKTKVCC